MNYRTLCITDCSDLPETELFIGLKKAGVDIEVCCNPTGKHYERLKESDVPVIDLKLKGRFDLSGIRRLSAQLKAKQYNILYCFNNHAASNVLKWYWWRFNGYGYFSGMLSGIVAALVIPKLLPDISALNSFPIILCISSLFCIFASLLTKPEADDVLMQFYRRVRPWGLWGPIHKKVAALYPEFKKNTV